MVGYKQTDIGLIPEDWEVRTIGEFFDFKNGLNKEKKYFGHGIPIVNYMDVFNNLGITKKNIKGLVSLNNDEIRNYEVRKGDVFFTRTSETTDEIGITSVVLEELEKTVFSGFILRARSKNNELSIGFKKYCFSSENVRKEIISKSSYTTRALTNGTLLSNVQIQIPPLPEQEAIAQVLSDTDALITALEKRIAKKRLIKQGAMQKLLTPKDDWEVKKLGEVCDIKKGEQLNKDKMRDIEKYPVINGGVLPSGYTNKYNQVENTITISEGGNSCGYVNYMRVKFWQGGHCYSLKTTMNKSYLYSYLKFNEGIIMSLRVGSGLPNIQRNRLEEFDVFLPPPSEQTRLATILSDMDSEIDALGKRLFKTKELKQGLMQQLLTGKIRLA